MMSKARETGDVDERKHKNQEQNDGCGTAGLQTSQSKAHRGKEREWGRYCLLYSLALKEARARGGGIYTKGTTVFLRTK